MKELNESQEIRDVYNRIDLFYLEIEKAKAYYDKIFKNRSDFDKMLDRTTGFQQKKGKQLAKIMIRFLTQIIKCKKLIDADTFADQKVVDGLKTMLDKDAPSK